MSSTFPSSPRPAMATRPIRQHSSCPHLCRTRLISERWAMGRLVLWLWFGFLVQVQTAAAQPDPVKNFCRRFGHQTAVIDRKLYIDGGLLNYNPVSQYPANYSNTALLYHDLDVLGSAGMPQLYANLTKNNSIPSVHGGTLWVDDINKRFYLFGGEFYQQPPSPYFTLWSFDVIYNEWVSFGTPNQGAINGVSYGAGVSVSERGEGYYYGGWMSNNSVLDWSGPPVATSGMIKYDMDSNSWTNITGPDSVRRAEGAMVFLPIGDGGMLVYFGGVQDKYNNGTVVGQPMEEIYIYDVLSSKWYAQNATGDVPEMRARFCAGATWAGDQSSYNIYLYGGAGMPPHTAGFDDLYILSIPSFQWIKLFPNDTSTGQYPHHSLTCNVVSNAQMLIIGGSFPLTKQCDVPDQFGSHNVDLGLQNPDHAPWKLFLPNLTSYAVPDPILSAVGGSAKGGATKTAPASGFDNPDLKVLMTRKASIAVRTPTRAISYPSTGPAGGTLLLPGAIAGIAVGCTVAAILLLAACIWFAKKRRRESSPKINSDKPLPPGVHIDNNGTPWSPQGSSNTTSYTPSSPHPTSPFLVHHTSSSGRYYPPVELEAPPGSHTWHGPDGVVYELVSHPDQEAGVISGAGMNYPSSSPTHGASSTVSSGVLGRSGSGSGELGGLQTKVDSEGRVWIQVPIPGTPGTPGQYPGGGGGGGGGTSPGGHGYSRYSPATPASSLGVGPGTGPRIVGHHPGSVPVPQELPTGRVQELPTGEFGDETGVVYPGSSGGSGQGGTGWRHQTYYHP